MTKEAGPAGQEIKSSEEYISLADGAVVISYRSMGALKSAMGLRGQLYVGIGGENTVGGKAFNSHSADFCCGTDGEECVFFYDNGVRHLAQKLFDHYLYKVNPQNFTKGSKGESWETEEKMDKAVCRFFNFDGERTIQLDLEARYLIYQELESLYGTRRADQETGRFDGFLTRARMEGYFTRLREAQETMNSTEWSQLIEKHFDHYKHIVGLYIRNIMEISVAHELGHAQDFEQNLGEVQHRNQHLKEVDNFYKKMRRQTVTATALGVGALAAAAMGAADIAQVAGAAAAVVAGAILSLTWAEQVEDSSVRTIFYEDEIAAYSAQLNYAPLYRLLGGVKVDEEKLVGSVWGADWRERFR